MSLELCTQPARRVTTFLKWAGGKRWLVERHADKFPNFTGTYYEPFLGGGSVFFHLAPEKAVLSDMNGRLIECYIEIRDNHSAIDDLLSVHHELHSSDYYYEVRGATFESSTERAAQFLYLNRTCFNGLYRVNKRGEFNVPVGSKTKVSFMQGELQRLSEQLAGSTLLVRDFEVSIDAADEGDMVFVDPPYTVKHNFNGFLKYNENIFSWQDQLRLREAVGRAAAKGVRVVVSNAAHSSVRDLYADLGQTIELDRSSVLAGKSSARGDVQEILVVV